MNIQFASKRLQKELSEDKAMIKAHGPLRSKKAQDCPDDVACCTKLGGVRSTDEPPHRCHELTGNRKRQLTVDLDHPYRLVFRVSQDPLPERVEGGLDWKQVTAIELIEIEDTHG
jgi:hypothetical protein